MNRISVLGGIVLAGAVSMAVGAYQQPAGAGGQQASRTIDVEKLAYNLYVLRNGGGNSAVFIRAAGVTVVDTKNPGWGQPLLDKIKELTDKPVTMIINTHTHGDHVSGNVEFPATAQVVTHENTKANMARMQPPPGGPPPAKPTPNIFTVHNGRGLPSTTFTDYLSTGGGSDQIDVYYFGPAHTNGDAVVVFPYHRVMHMGDAFPGKQMPIMDSNNGGSGVGYAGMLTKAHDGVPAIERVITGHGPTMPLVDLLEYSSFIRDFVESVRAAKKEGRTVDEIVKAWTIPAKYQGYAVPQEARLRANVELVLKELQ